MAIDGGASELQDCLVFLRPLKRRLVNHHALVSAPKAALLATEPPLSPCTQKSSCFDVWTSYSQPREATRENRRFLSPWSIPHAVTKPRDDVDCAAVPSSGYRHGPLTEAARLQHLANASIGTEIFLASASAERPDRDCRIMIARRPPWSHCRYHRAMALELGISSAKGCPCRF